MTSSKTKTTKVAEKQKDKLSKLISKLPDLDITEKDIKGMLLSLILDVDGDTPQHAKVKVDAIKLLSDIVKEENKSTEENFDNITILKVLTGGK